MTEFFHAYQYKVEGDVFQRVTTIVMNSVKSSNPTTRANAVTLLQTVLQRSPDSSNEEHCLNEIISPLKSGKSTGPDHRLALFTMLLSVNPSSITSPSVIEHAPNLLVKETSEPAIAQLAKASVPHLAFLLQHDIRITASSIATIVREMQSTKPALRRAMCTLVGEVLYKCGKAGDKTGALKEFMKAITPALEGNFKAVTANPLAAPAGPLEGYVALASLLGIFAKFTEFGISPFFMYHSADPFSDVF